MASVVSTVAASLKTPDFHGLHKTTRAPVCDESSNLQLHSVLLEKQTSVRGLMGVSGVSGDEGNVVALMPIFMCLQLTDSICEQRKAGGMDVLLNVSETSYYPSLFMRHL